MADDGSQRYKATLSKDDIKAIKEEAAEEARIKMVIEQLVSDQEKTAKHFATVTRTLNQISGDLAAGREVMATIKSQAEQSIKVGEAAMVSSQANTEALLNHMNTHSSDGTTALIRKQTPWWTPIVVQVTGTILAAALLGGLYASFFMKVPAPAATAPAVSAP